MEGTPLATNHLTPLYGILHIKKAMSYTSLHQPWWEEVHASLGRGTDDHHQTRPSPKHDLLSPALPNFPEDICSGFQSSIA